LQEQDVRSRVRRGKQKNGQTKQSEKMCKNNNIIYFPFINIMLFVDDEERKKNQHKRKEMILKKKRDEVCIFFILN
jgi:hypothetical protein